MTTFTIATAAYASSYEGATAEEAILAYVRDMGYETIAEAADVVGQSVEDFIAELQVSRDREVAA